MARFDPIWALGMMSGTSLDGVDAAMVMTDGEKVFGVGDCDFRPYTKEERETLTAALGLFQDGDPTLLNAAKQVIEDSHIELAKQFPDAQVIGFHGQTLAHDPDNGRTHQLGRGAAIATALGKQTVSDFRSNDMKEGGQGAPLAPFYHFALAKQIGITNPVAMVNLGGVGNVTWINPSKLAPEDDGALLAFDTGPANAPINDFMQSALGKEFDRNGEIAKSGVVSGEVLEKLFENPYFEQRPPKSLDRNDFNHIHEMVEGLTTEDAVATLTAFCASSVYAAQMHFPDDVTRWLICGGGRKNVAAMNSLKSMMTANVAPIEDVGLDGDMLEAQAFAYLAVRSLRGMPISAPSTTGCAKPSTGGVISNP